MSFIHLHVYSAFSLLKSTASIKELVYSAKEKGYKALALTDHNVMHGAVAFYKECKKAGIKPVFGLTADVESEIDPAKSFPLILLAKDQKGFENLLKISSVVQTKAENGIPVKWLKHYSEGLIAITPGNEGEIEHTLMNKDEEAAEKVLEGYRSIFKENHFYMALQFQHENDQEPINKAKLNFAKKFNIPLAVTNPVYYIKREDAFSHGCLLAIKNGEKLQDEHREMLKSDQYYLKSPQEMVDCFSEFPDALENTLFINERCQFELDLHKQHLPKFPLQDGITPEEQLEKLCYDGLLNRVPAYTEAYKERIKYELSVIKKMKFSDYFLIVWDFMRYARENGILTGPGRGSAAGSLVAYVLFITDVDPIEYQLLFERFLNPERISMPDIDIDFPDHRRDEVIEYVADKYGKIHVAQIATFGTFAAKAALRDVGRVFGLNPKELDMLSRMVPSRLGITLENAYKESQALQAFVKEDNLNQRLFDTAIKLEGLPRHISTHAAGVVISEKPLVDLVPIQKGHNDVYLTQYSMEHLEDVGLLKMDFLGLRNLSLIESIAASIHKNKGTKIDVRKIPLDDPETYRMLSRGETTGIFQLESDGMRKVLMRLKPTGFEDIVAVNALYRPGPMENIPSFINRKHGIEIVKYPHDDLKPILENTYGIIVYQEQIMQIAYKMAGFSLGQADLLRRAIGKKKKEVLDEERKRFVNGAAGQGYDLGLADEIYDLIVKFADYGFNRSHAVAYSMISCQLAYLKKHYYPFFMAELMTSVSGNEMKLAQYIREAKQNGLNILPPSINRSSHRFHVEKNDIRFSLASIKGVGATVLKEIFTSRKAKKFEDLFDFCLRVSPKIINRKILETLVHSGSFDEFGEDRAVLLASIDVALDHAQLVKPDESGQFDLFEEEAFSLKPKYTEVDPIRIEDKLDFEKQALGLYLSDHPMSVYEQELKSKGAYSLYEITKDIKEAAVGVYITELRKIRTKKGEAMAFLAVSDSSGEMDAVVFPAIFKKCSQLFNQGTLVILEGKLEEREGKKQLVVQGAFEPNVWFENKKSQDSTLYIKVTVNRDSPELLQKVKSLLNEHKGNSSVVVFSENTKKSVKLSSDDRVNPDSILLAKLKNMLGESNVILQKNNSLQ